MPVIYRTLRTKICRTICPHPIQSTFSEDRAETECFVLGENRIEDSKPHDDLPTQIARHVTPGGEKNDDLVTALAESNAVSPTCLLGLLEDQRITGEGFVE